MENVKNLTIWCVIFYVNFRINLILLEIWLKIWYILYVEALKKQE